MQQSADRAPSSGRRWPAWAAAAAVFVVALAFQVARIPALEHDVVWAEDGAIFLLGALQDPAGSILAPYAGYQHLLPRLLAGAVVALAPLASYAAVVFWASAIVAALVCAATIPLARWAVPWLPARIALGVVPVVVPLIAPEIIGNLADLHTFMLWLGVWIALSMPTSRHESWLVAVAAFVAAMTEVQLLLMLPVLLLRIHLRRRLLWPVIGGFLLGLGGQALSWLLAPRGGYDGVPIGIPDVVVGWLSNVVMPTLQPTEQGIREAFASQGPLAAAPILAVFSIASLVVIIWGSWRARIAGAVVLLASASSFGGSLLASPIEQFQYASFRGDDWLTAIVDLRYGGAAGMLLAAIVPIAASVAVERLRGRWLAVATPVLALGLVAFVGAMAWQSPDTGSHRIGVEPWSVQVDRQAAACEGGDAPEDLLIAPYNRALVLDCPAIVGEP
ncbi:hypothetical protein [Agrococcus jenensis]|uniref:DUF2029 domain-containing protein n=1 Tax=Agrococcus jenensis TaxID=46353 RepID=A0A3N2APC3_9MICO|nr:hypothetical protein [Agrococcus jenensis]ROR64899.1 hypothetical protein EDD26_0251 [Agrococcus jenensis]